MDSIKNYAELEYQKDLINQLLRTSFVDIPEEQYEELTELVFTKINLMNNLRVMLNSSNKGTIGTTAEQYGVSTDNVLDSFIYFTLLVENVMLIKQLTESIEN